MSLGDSNQNQDSGKKPAYSPITYSPMSFKNPASTIPSEISFSYWKGTLAIGISSMLPRKPGATYDEYDRENAVTIYLNSSKARIFKKEVDMYMSDRTAFNSVAVCNGNATTEICLMNGADVGIDGDIILIRKVDEKGNEVGSLGYELNNSEKYYFSMRNVNLETNNADYKYFKNIEMESIQDLLEDYYRSCSYAIAASVHDGMRYTINPIRNGIDSLLESAGIATGKRKTAGGGGGSFFSRAAGAGTGSTGTSNTNDRKAASSSMSLESFAGEDD